MSSGAKINVKIIPVTSFQQNCALIRCMEKDQTLILDPGGDVELILKELDEGQHRPLALVLTHGHIDHVGGVVDLAKALNVPIWGPHKDDLPLLEALPTQAHMFGVDQIKVPEPDRWFEDGDMLECGALVFDIYHCPGHAPGHVIYVEHNLSFAIMGDVLFQGSIGRTDLPLGDHDVLMASIRDKVLPLSDDMAFICGHGAPSTIGQERAKNPFLQGLRSIHQSL